MAYSLVSGQKATNNGTSASLTATLPSTPTPYNLILLSVSINKNQIPTANTGSTFGSGTSMTQLGEFNGNGWGIGVFALIVPTSGAVTTYTAGYSTSTNTQVNVSEWKGNLNTLTGIIDNSSSATQTVSPNEINITINNSNDLLFSSIYWNGGSPGTTSYPGLALTQLQFNNTLLLESYYISPSTGTQDSWIGWTAGSDNSHQIVVALNSAAAPTVTGLGTSSGPTSGGTSVTITGTNLDRATSIKFGTNSATSISANTSTSVTCVSPAGTGIVDVTVVTSGGTSATSSSDKFTYAGGTGDFLFFF